MLKKLHPRIAAYTLIVTALSILAFRYPFVKPQSSRNGQGVPAGFASYLDAAKQAAVQAKSPYQTPPPDSAPTLKKYTKKGKKKVIPVERQEPKLLPMARSKRAFPHSPGVLGFFSLLPDNPGMAWAVFSSLCLVAFGAALFLGANYSDWNQVFLLFVGMFISWKAVLENLDYGQFELLLFGLGGLSASLLGRQSFLAGLVAGVMPWVKIPWLVMIVPLMAASVQRTEKKGRLFFSGFFASAFLVGVVVPSLIFGSDELMLLAQEWFLQMMGYPESLYLSELNQSLWVSMVRWVGGVNGIALGLTGIGLGLLTGRLVGELERYRPMRRISPLAWVSPWMLLIQLLSPFSWTWNSIFLLGLPMAAAMVDLHGTEDRVRKLPLSLLAFGLVVWLWQETNWAVQLGLPSYESALSHGAVTGIWLIILFLSIAPGPGLWRRLYSSVDRRGNLIK